MPDNPEGEVSRATNATAGSWWALRSSKLQQGDFGAVRPDDDFAVALRGLVQHSRQHAR